MEALLTTTSSRQNITPYSFTPCRDTANSPRAGITINRAPYPTPVALAPMLSHIPNYFRMTTTTQLDKLPLSIIIFRTTDNTNVFNNYKTCLKEIQLLVQQVSIVTASNETLPFYFRFKTTNICYFRTYVYKC